MKLSLVTLLAVFCASQEVSAQVVGSPWGFARGVTGGGSATPVYPQTNAELVSLLGSSEPQVIVLTKTFQFLGTEGTTSANGCAPWGTGSACQLAINALDWCGDRAPYPVTYDNAPTNLIHVASHKTLVGQGNKGVISGKGLRFTNDVTNIIVQNIHFTDLNPKYVWGGDALVFHGSDLIWIDHVTTSLVGRQHYVFGFGPNKRITISHSHIDGRSPWSTSCNGHHYWNILLGGGGDTITFQNNYVQSTAGRGPSLGGNTLFHAVNSVWSDVVGHTLEGEGPALFEGCYFENVQEIAGSGSQNLIFSASPANRAQCQSYLGRTCLPNGYYNSATFDRGDTSILSKFVGLPIAPAGSADEARANVPNNAGFGKI